MTDSITALVLLAGFLMIAAMIFGWRTKRMKKKDVAGKGQQPREMREFPMKKKINPLFQEHVFRRAVQDPLPWLHTATILKEAADKLCWLDANHKPIDDKEPNLSRYIPIYRMLLGLSFENLIKGLLVAQEKTDIIKNEKLNPIFTQHKIGHLLQQLDTSKLELTDKEHEVLLELERYVVWQGRYPIPKGAEGYMIPSHGTGEHAIEQELWQKMFEYLVSIGWRLGFDGKRLPLKKGKDS